jgi:hypothetical protein
MGSATIWAIFSQTHLVTLFATNKNSLDNSFFTPATNVVKTLF